MISIKSLLVLVLLAAIAVNSVGSRIMNFPSNFEGRGNIPPKITLNHADAISSIIQAPRFCPYGYPVIGGKCADAEY